jgi:hypothetical protein
MAKTSSIEQNGAQADTGHGKREKEFPLTLDEFCKRLSLTDKRVEAIGGFHASEKSAKRTRGLESAFRERYAEFLNKPM